jgi:flagellar biosynthesis/type III secretory pathway M-ring protein FliF/YscJ
MSKEEDKEPVIPSAAHPGDANKIFAPGDGGEEMMTPGSSEVAKRVSDLTRTMHSNLQSLLRRGSSLNELEQKVVNVEFGSKQFSRTAVKVDDRLWWLENRWKVAASWIFGIFVVVLIIYFYITRVIFD